MTKDEAAQLLNVSVNASQPEIQTKFQEMFNEYQIRLTNAPTPNLKKIYQNNLQELNTALSVLSGKSSAAVSDLPSSSPTYKHVDHQHSTPPPTPPPSTQTTDDKTSAPQTKGAVKEKGKDKKGVPSSTITAIGVALVAFAAVVFLVIKIVEDKGKIAKIQLSADSVTTVMTELTLYKGLFDNQKLKIKNDCNDDIKIGVLNVTYWTEDHKLKKIEMWYDRSIRKGSSLPLDIVEGTRVEWDGSVVSYGLGIEYRGAQFIISGIFQKDMKEEDKTLHINLDDL